MSTSGGDPTCDLPIWQEALQLAKRCREGRQASAQHPIQHPCSLEPQSRAILKPARELHNQASLARAAFAPACRAHDA